MKGEIVFRTLAATGAASVLVLVGLVGVANAEDGPDCSGFGTQEQAQSAYDGMNRPADRKGLDPDGDGIACEELPSALDPGIDPELGDDDATDDDPTRDYGADDDVAVPTRIDTGGGAMAAHR
nr:excalibur calcium-binding domain-containing protein [Actinopolymorpha pittospori]